LSSVTTPIAYLEATIGEEKRKFVIPSNAALRIGRSDTGGVVLNHPSVSRRHALLQRAEDNQYYLTDLGSSNGTFVNHGRVSSPVMLKSGDRITIGNYSLIFVDEATGTVRTTSGESLITNVLFAPKLITVLVADIRDFTGLAQHMDAPLLSRVAGTLFRRAGKVLQERGAWGQKYIGDAVMAVWLHEGLGPEPAELLTVFEALSQLHEIAASLQSALGLSAPIRLGAGMNTGLASVGNVGSLANADYTALGDVVNMAFRLESATRELACDLAMGQETYHFLEASINPTGLVQHCNAKLKGYEHPMPAYTMPLAMLPALLKAFRERLRPGA
jgi:adenylate cyclase